MPKYVFALTSTRLADAGGVTFPVNVNDVWDAEDPLVVRNSQYFGDEPVHLNRSVPNRIEQESLAAARGVEAATRAPGEQRKRGWYDPSAKKAQDDQPPI